MSTKTLAQQILDADDTETVPFDVPEWNVKLELRSPSGEERSALQRSFVDMDATMAAGAVQLRDLKVMYPALIVACAYDPDTGERVFEGFDADTFAALNRKNGAVLERIAQRCLDLVGLTAEAVDEKKGGSSTSPSSEPPSL